jgi:hypothetical protein
MSLVELAEGRHRPHRPREEGDGAVEGECRRRRWRPSSSARHRGRGRGLHDLPPRLRAAGRERDRGLPRRQARDLRGAAGSGATFKALDREAAGFSRRSSPSPRRRCARAPPSRPTSCCATSTATSSRRRSSRRTATCRCSTSCAASSIAKKDADFQAWLKSGGANATMISMDRRYLQERSTSSPTAPRRAKRVWNVVKAPIELLRITSELVENATRLGEFKRAAAATAARPRRRKRLRGARGDARLRAHGREDPGAEHDHRLLERAGRGSIAPCAPSRMQPARAPPRRWAYITLPSVLLWWANHDDPRWKEIPDWERDLFWIVLTKEHIYRIPKPFELGVLFGSCPSACSTSSWMTSPTRAKASRPRSRRRSCQRDADGRGARSSST